MDIKTDYQSIIMEVKERNRLFLALSQIREITASFHNKDMSEEFKGKLETILKKCDEALGKLE